MFVGVLESSDLITIKCKAENNNFYTGVSSLDAKSSGRLGLVSILYIVITQLIGCCIGVALGMIVKPGAKFSQDQNFKMSNTTTNYGDVFADLLRSKF